MPTSISASKLKSGNLYETLRFLRAADKENFDKAFSTVGVVVTSESDLQTLADYGEQSKLGFSPKDKSGNTINFDLFKIMHSIPIRHSALDASGIRMVA